MKYFYRQALSSINYGLLRSYSLGRLLLALSVCLFTRYLLYESRYSHARSSSFI
jgi:hypothetical protein